jgi:hypothetical protein
MKNILLISLLLLFTFSLKAQSFKTTLNKKVDSINSILEKEKMVRFTNQNSDVFYPKKIKANLQGDLFCIDSSTSDNVELKRLMFNLLKVNSFVIEENEIKAFGQNKKPIVEIFIGNNQNRNALKKELIALQLICVSYSKQNPKYKCD